MDVDLTGVFDDDDFEEGGKVIILNTITYNVCGNLSKKSVENSTLEGGSGLGHFPHFFSKKIISCV